MGLRENTVSSIGIHATEPFECGMENNSWQVVGAHWRGSFSEKERLIQN
jgi:hypothetical protein